MDAAQVPAWIIGLASPDKSLRHAAYGKLWQFAHCYIESLSEYEEALETDALVLATPFLVELLKSPYAYKAHLFELLNTLASYHHVNELEGIYKQRADRIHQNLRSRFNLFFTFVDDDDENVRIESVYLLGNFEDKSSFVIDFALSKLENKREPDILARQCAAEMVYRKLKKQIGLEFQDRFVALMRLWLYTSDEPLEIRAEAAQYLVELGYGDQKAIETSFESIGLSDYYFKLRSLLKLDDDLILDSFLLALEILEDRYVVEYLAEILLLIAFLKKEDRFWQGYGWETYGRRPTLSIEKPLSPLQKQILSALIAKETLWIHKTDVFENFSLPDSKTALQQFIDD